MNDSFIVETLKSLRARLRLVRLCERLALALAFSSASAVIAMAALKSLGFGAEALPWSLLFLVPGFLVPCLLYFFERLPLMHVALAADERLHLQERLSTFYEWTSQGLPRTLMFKGLMRDAASSAAGIDPKAAFPLGFPASGRVNALTVPLLVLLMATPAWGLIRFDRAWREASAVAMSAQTIERAAEKLRSAGKRVPGAGATAAKLKALGVDLKSPSVGRPHAVARLADASEKLKEQRDRLSAAASSLEKLNRALSPAPRAGSSRMAARSALGDVERMAQRLERESPSADEMSRMRRDLASAASSLGQGDPLKRELDEALDAMRRGDRKEALEKLRTLSERMEQAAMGAEGAGDLDRLIRELDAAKNAVAGDTECDFPEGESDGAMSAAQAGDPSQDARGSAGRGGDGEDAEPVRAGALKREYIASRAKRPSDFGVGSTNREAHSGGDEAKDYVLRRQGARTSRWREPYERLYEGERFRLKTATARVRGKVAGSYGTFTSSEARGGVPVAEASADDAQRRHSVSMGRAEEAVGRETIPAEYRTLVRDYFKGIDPGR